MYPRFVVRALLLLAFVSLTFAQSARAGVFISVRFAQPHCLFTFSRLALSRISSGLLGTGRMTTTLKNTIGFLEPGFLHPLKGRSGLRRTGDGMTICTSFIPAIGDGTLATMVA